MLFSPTLASKPQVVVLNKIDLKHVEEKSDVLMKTLLASMPHKRLLCMSAAGRIGVDEVVDRTYNFLRKLKADLKVAEDKRIFDEKKSQKEEKMVTSYDDDEKY